MKSVNIEAGDVFCSVNQSKAVGWGIRFIEKIRSQDGKSRFGHAGIITTDNGQTLEALNRIENSHIDKYIGTKVLIARPVTNLKDKILPKDLKIKTIVQLEEEHLGQIYPWWRIPLHLFTVVARNVSIKRKYVVCSELTGKYLFRMNCILAKPTGLTPDDIDDKIRTNKCFQIIHDGILEA